MNIFSFIAAASNSGKTTLIEKIVRLLKTRELRVAVIKHASKGFNLHPELCGYLNSGADPIIVVGDSKVAMISTIEGHPDLEEMGKIIGDVDIILCEGFKSTAVNKIEVFRYGVSGKRPLCMDDASFLAFVSDTPFDVAIPQFDLNDEKGVAAFLMDRIGNVEHT